MRSTAQLIKHYRELHGWNQSELARRLGLTPQAVQYWEQRDKPPKSSLIPKIAQAFGVEPRDLAPGSPLRKLSARQLQEDLVDETSSEGVTESDENFALVPKGKSGPSKSFVDAARVRISYLPITATKGTDVDSITVSPAWVARHMPGRNPTSIRIIEALGDAHAPTLEHGDWMFVDTDTRGVDFDAVWVLKHKDTGEIWVRRVQRQIDGSWVLKCDNSTYEPIRVSKDERANFDVIGQACRRVNFAPL